MNLLSLLNDFQPVISSSALKDSFVEQFTGNQLNFGKATLSVLISLALGFLIMVVYKKTFRGVVYSANFGMSLVLMSVITTVIIVTITSNVVLSLGMVGALSIVRFRSAIKDPVDIMYLFWAISMGIVVGAGQYLFAAAASALIAVLCFVLFSMNAKNEAYLLIIRYDTRVGGHIDSMVNQLGGKLRNKTATAQRAEVTVELKAGQIPKNVVEKISSTDGVYSAVLVNYNGEYCD